ncbi:MAG: hypothetical protein HKO71_05605 [Pseudomonadales bacterium]|nr:hypothetical protein [Pseudomonadales bacterium]
MMHWYLWRRLSNHTHTEYSKSQHWRTAARQSLPWLLVLLAALLAVVWPANALAQFSGMKPSGMQSMLQAAQQAQECLARVNQRAVQQLADEAKIVEQDIKHLCRAGNWREAEELAVTFGRRMSSDPDVVAMRKCGSAVAGILPKLPHTGAQAGEREGAAHRQHLCDRY